MRQWGAWCVHFHWAVVADRFECVGLQVHSDRRNKTCPLPRSATPQPVTAALIRSLPVARLIDAERIRQRDYLARTFRGRMQPASAGGRRAIEELERQWEPGRAGRRPIYGAEHFRQVAAAYSEAVAGGAAPTRAVAERWTVSHSTAAKWVAEARRRGELPATEKGRPRA